LRLDAEGKAEPVDTDVEWTPADGDLARYCPTDALDVTPTVVTADVSDAA
jgi:hypothetical protein